MSGHLKPSAVRVLVALQAAGSRGATTHELGQHDVGGFRYSARILELREAGYRITKSYEREGSYRYTLVETTHLKVAA